jgi:hypothetical protein
MDAFDKLEKETFTLTVPTVISKGRIYSLLCGALEGGSNYWYCDARVKTLPEGTTLADFDFWHLEVPLAEGGAIEIAENTDLDDDDREYHALDMDAIRRGCLVMAEKYTRHWQDFVTEGDDAITSDVFLQCCLLGDVVYG